MRRLTQTKLRLVHVELDDANDFVADHHRHSDPVVGHRYSLGCIDETGRLRGVSICGRPVARMRNQRTVIEILRVATDGHPNASSFLYRASVRAAVALGYETVGTYTLKTEPGTSLLAAGFKILHAVKGREWDTPSRRRRTKGGSQTTDKFWWEPAEMAEESTS